MGRLENGGNVGTDFIDVRLIQMGKSEVMKGMFI